MSFGESHSRYYHRFNGPYMAEQTKFWYLKHFNFFEGMDTHMMEKVEKLALMSKVKKHEPIYFPDEPSSSIFLLKEGYVKLTRNSPEGKEVILDVIGPGEIFGELSIIDEKEPRNEFAEVLNDAVICTIKKSDFEQLTSINPGLTLQLTKRIGLRLRKFEERVTDLAFKDVRTRLASLLFRLAEDYGTIHKGIVKIKTNLSHQEIGLLIGAARQTVTTYMNDFRTEGIIDFSRTEIVIINIQRLRDMTG
jgi:CRP/FNR family transcriptional regulator, cyclic AMP receptor protein